MYNIRTKVYKFINICNIIFKIHVISVPVPELNVLYTFKTLMFTTFYNKSLLGESMCSNWRYFWHMKYFLALTTSE